MTAQINMFDVLYELELKTEHNVYADLVKSTNCPMNEEVREQMRGHLKRIDERLLKRFKIEAHADMLFEFHYARD